jgi:hypothetical protein
MPANPEFQELIIKHTALGLLTEVPEMQIYSLRHMKRRRISKELYWCSCYSYFIRMLAAKLVIEELTPCTDVFFHFPNTHSALKWPIVYHSLSKMN